MPNASVYTAMAEKSGTFTLPDEFGREVDSAVLYHAVRSFLGNQRQGTHSTKTRAQVSGGSSKPWRQKGTGRARQGTIRAAQWRGGGVVFGPRPRRHRVELPKKVRRRARECALSARASDDAVYVVEEFEFEQGPKTKKLLEILGKLGLEGQNVLVLIDQNKPEVYKSGRNIGNVHVMRFAEATAYEILWSNALVIEKSALGEASSVEKSRDKESDDE